MEKLFFIYLLPLVFSFIFSLGFKVKEKIITRLSSISLLLPALVSLYYFFSYFKTEKLPLEIHLFNLTIFDHHFPFILWIDFYSIVFLILTHILGLLVVRYSHGYLHLEKGFQRFFATILFFIFGMYLLSLAGTIDMFFAGWEIVGMSSFLLIAFYRSHSRSVLNAMRIYNVYRICDVGLLLGAVMGHLLWHEAGRFSVLAGLGMEDFAKEHATGLLVISFLVILASLGKSAQFPFYNWPSRAMEGPTPSSAIFYGALSIHAGVFLLIRTYPIWSYHLIAKITIALIGLTTFLLSFFQQKVQSNIKGQISYAITGNIGLMYIELSFGLLDLVIIHIFCHALYRCFQLLVSPSIVFNSLTINNLVVGRKKSGLPQVSSTLFSLALADFYLDLSWRGLSFFGWKKLFWKLKKILMKPIFILLLSLLLSLIVFKDWNLPLFLGGIGLALALRSLLIHQSPFFSILEYSLSVVIIMWAAFIINPHHFEGVKIYLVSIFPALLVASFVSYRFKHHSMLSFHALGTKNQFLANLFFISFLIISGMPVSTAFIGEDILLEEIISYSHLLASFTTIILTIGGFIGLRIYSRLFMGRPS
jgi:NADH-quinone oxidoreductase subunit L